MTFMSERLVGQRWAGRGLSDPVGRRGCDGGYQRCHSPLRRSDWSSFKAARPVSCQRSWNAAIYKWLCKTLDGTYKGKQGFSCSFEITEQSQSTSFKLFMKSKLQKCVKSSWLLCLSNNHTYITFVLFTTSKKSK